MGRMILGCMLLATVLAFAAATMARPALGQGAHARVAGAVHQIAPDVDSQAGGADTLAGVTGYALAVGMILTLIALVGLRACGRQTAHPGARRQRRL